MSRYTLILFALPYSLTLVSVALGHENLSFSKVPEKPNLKRRSLPNNKELRETFHYRNCYSIELWERHESCLVSTRVMLADVTHASQHHTPEACQKNLGIDVCFYRERHDSPCLTTWLMLDDVIHAYSVFSTILGGVCDVRYFLLKINCANLWLHNIECVFSVAHSFLCLKHYFWLCHENHPPSIGVSTK